MHSPRCLSLIAGLILSASLATLLTAQTQQAATSEQNTVSQSERPISEVTIPGPLRSFLRMAGISQQAPLEEVLPLFARNVYVQGYVGWQDRGRPTEFLILLGRYVNQAKELADMAGPAETIHVPNCEGALPLLRVLGYRLRQPCGKSDGFLITADPERAFLTTDSGFPLPALEEAIQHGRDFEYRFPSVRVPVVFDENTWLSTLPTGAKDKNLVQAFLHHPALARLYWALSRDDDQTRDALRDSVGLKKLLPFAAELDFYGNQIYIQSGKVQVPGGSAEEEDWKDLVGANPDSPAEFVPKLLAKDNGWLAAYYDSLARVSREQQTKLSETHRLKTFYAAFRGSDFSSNAARPAFRRAPGLLLLMTRLQWDENGKPLVPGGLSIWKEILSQKDQVKLVHEWSKRANHWNNPDQLVEGMFAFARLETDASPLQMYLLFTELESKRLPQRQLSADTLKLMARRFGDYDDQYVIFSEFPELDDASITSFVKTADAIDKIPNRTLRGNTMGTFQADLGLWQILARQGQITADKMNASWQDTLKPFAKITSETQLVDAGRNSLGALMEAATGKPSIEQDEIIELLAGPRQNDPEGRRIHQDMARQIRAVMDGQRLVSLDTLLALDQGLTEIAQGKSNVSSLTTLAGELREFEMPRPIFSSSERTEWAAGLYNQRHTELQMQTDIAKVLSSPSSRTQAEQSRGQLAPFLRDTLVGLNYAYYAPPGAQLLHINPLFVRSHDFSGETVMGVENLWRAPQLFGQGSPAGGGAHFVGSIADLPYVLSDAEQDFIAPENVQALIWREAVPGLLADAVIPRWWNVSRTELHAVALYQAAGEELVRASASSDDLRRKVIGILSERMSPERASMAEHDLQQGQAEDALARLTPADTFYLTVEVRRRFHDEGTAWGPSGQELERLSQTNPSEVNFDRLSKDFGIPHRTLAQSYGCELLNVKPFPAFAGYSSRLMAESWDSNNLYWARLADEMGYSPVTLNRLVPELTRRMIEKIFATDFEDWAALLRAMRQAGTEFRQGKIDVVPATRASASPLPN